jgi:hypothetical protein
MADRILFSIEQALAAAQTDAFGGRSEQKSSDLLRRKARSALAHAASTWRPQHTARAQEKWEALIERATAKPTSLGFILLGTGGTEALGELLGTSAGNAAATARRWEELGVVRRFDRTRDRGLPLLTGLQIPELTDALVWFAARAFYKLSGPGAGGAPMTIAQAQHIAALCLERRQPLPEITSFGQASALLDKLAGS